MTGAATPELADLLQAAVQSALFELHTAMPGQVVAVQAGALGRQFVDVRPCLKRSLEVDDDDPGVTAPFIEEELPTLPRVPVGYPQGGGFFVSLPLQVGDFVLLVFCERSIDRWLATASKARQAAVSTGDVGLHLLDGAVALPLGPAPLRELLGHVSGTDLVLGHVSGTPLLAMAADGTVTLKGTLVVSGEVTAGASNPATQVALTAHKHGTAMGPSTQPLPPGS
jgi:Phage protein Gp138 N-terminal domain